MSWVLLRLVKCTAGVGRNSGEARAGAAHQLPVLIDAPAEDDGLDRRLLHVRRQLPAQVPHAADLAIDKGLSRGY